MNDIKKMMKYLDNDGYFEVRGCPDSILEKDQREEMYLVYENGVLNYYGYYESHHNGDHEDCVYQELPLNEENLNMLKKALLRECKEQALHEMEQIKEFEEDQKVNNYLKKKGVL